MNSTTEIASSFIEGAPPGEVCEGQLADVVADIKALTVDGPNILPSLGPAFERYNETQLATVKLPGGNQEVGTGTNLLWLSLSASITNLVQTNTTTRRVGYLLRLIMPRKYVYILIPRQISALAFAFYGIKERPLTLPCTREQKVSAVQPHRFDSRNADLMYIPRVSVSPSP
ncbi:hypothetical protein Egran_03584 [Elaphomyces granulatus]|uniref:F-actin-capping protein subunit alpha n=1 Tax=Elaphomyces granulatus TaxID=519963 RepID=A0A232LX06_9EURO|nr:hypothetical protein Egran_03584 [Elaphomyces granulatus]